MGLLLNGFCLGYNNNNISNYAADMLILTKFYLIDLPLYEGLLLLPCGTDPHC